MRMPTNVELIAYFKKLCNELGLNKTFVPKNLYSMTVDDWVHKYENKKLNLSEELLRTWALCELAIEKNADVYDLIRIVQYAMCIVDTEFYALDILLAKVDLRIPDLVKKYAIRGENTVYSEETIEL